MGKNPIVINSLNENGTTGVLLNIKAVRLTNGIRRRADVIFTLTDNESNDLLRNTISSSATLVGGYVKVFVVIGRNIAGHVVSGTRN